MLQHVVFSEDETSSTYSHGAPTESIKLCPKGRSASVVPSAYLRNAKELICTAFSLTSSRIPYSNRTRPAFGGIWIPAPIYPQGAPMSITVLSKWVIRILTSRSSEARSSTTVCKPQRQHWIAQDRPPSPAPIITTGLEVMLMEWPVSSALNF